MNGTTDIAVIECDGRAVTLHPKSHALRDEALERSALVGCVTDEATNIEATEAMKGLKRVITLTEKTRKEVKDPFWDLCGRIDAAAKDFVAEAVAEHARVARAAADYQTAQLERVRAQERARQLEAERIERERVEALRRIEEETRRIADEARRKAEAEAAAIKAEHGRLAREAKLQADAEAAAARTTSQKEAAKARSEAMAARVAAEAEAARTAAEAAARNEQERIASESAAKTKAEEERRAQELMSVALPTAPTTAAGQSARFEWDWAVMDLWQLARMHPALVEITPRRQQIREVINALGAAGGEPKVAGLRIWRETKVSVRVGKERTIEV